MPTAPSAAAGSDCPVSASAPEWSRPLPEPDPLPPCGWLLGVWQGGATGRRTAPFAASCFGWLIEDGIVGSCTIGSVCAVSDPLGPVTAPSVSTLGSAGLGTTDSPSVGTEVSAGRPRLSDAVRSPTIPRRHDDRPGRFLA